MMENKFPLHAKLISTSTRERNPSAFQFSPVLSCSHAIMRNVANGHTHGRGGGEPENMEERTLGTMTWKDTQQDLEFQTYDQEDAK
jgi:hypothetical protein